MDIFKRDPVKRLDETGLRYLYLEGKKNEKIITFLLMFICAVITIAVTSFSISKKIYWILIFAILGILWFIRLINRLSVIIEEIFENREVEE